MSRFQIRPLSDDDRAWVISLLEEQWGSVRFVTRGRLFRADEDPGFAAIRDEIELELLI